MTQKIPQVLLDKIFERFDENTPKQEIIDYLKNENKHEQTSDIDITDILKWVKNE